MNNKRKLIVVHWLDAWSTSGYYIDGSEHTPLEVQDIGFLMDENEHSIVLAQSVDENDSARHIVVIPWEMIQKVEELA